MLTAQFNHWPPTLTMRTVVCHQSDGLAFLVWLYTANYVALACFVFLGFFVFILLFTVSFRFSLALTNIVPCRDWLGQEFNSTTQIHPCLLKHLQKFDLDLPKLKKETFSAQNSETDKERETQNLVCSVLFFIEITLSFSISVHFFWFKIDMERTRKRVITVI